MIQFARPLFALGFAITLSACQRQAEPAKPAPAAAPAVLTADSIGVAECDNYITKYLACVSTKVPEAARVGMQRNVDTMREAWKASAGTDAGRAALADACRTATDSAKASLVAFGCTDF